MRYSNKLIEQIKDKIILSDFIGRDIQLKKVGKNYLGLSPFNREKTPSFNVNDEKGLYHCFSSGKGGDIFTYLIETKGVDYPQAVKRAAEFAGIYISYDERKNDKKYEKIDQVMKTINIAKNFFHQQIFEHKNNQATQFLKKRNIYQKTIENFKIGYAKDSFQQLKNYLVRQNIQQKTIVEAGLAIDKQDNGENLYDRFRNRIIFPIENQSGKCIGFGARAINQEQQPKYLNSPETIVFKKNQTLFNINRAAEAARKKNRLIVVEGYIDVVTLVQNGFDETVATLGTAISIQQIFNMWKIVEKPLICFDNDEPGQKASIRIIEKIIPYITADKTIAFIELKYNGDPDDFIKQYGADKFEEIIQNPRSIIEFLWQNHILKMKQNTPEEKAKCEKLAYHFVSLAQDKTIAKYFRQEIFNRFRQMWKINYKNENKQTFIKIIPNTENELKLLGQIINKPELIINNIELITKLKWKNPKVQQTIQNIINIIPQLIQNDNQEINLTQQIEKSNKIIFDENLKTILQKIDQSYLKDNYDKYRLDQNTPNPENQDPKNQDKDKLDKKQNNQFNYLIQMQKLYTLKNILEEEENLEEIYAIRTQIKKIQLKIDQYREQR